jgi:DNA-binding NarL/FixJ family response regulator
MTISVLLADDHVVVREGLRLLLEAQMDITVHGEASDGREVIRQAERLHPDVVVMDIAMPELNGIEATRQIRMVYPATQVVILSVHSTSEHVFRAFEAGALGYLLKESAGAELVEAVRAVHAGRRYLSHKLVKAGIDDQLSRRRGKGPVNSLSVREREVLQLIVEGKSSAEIAGILSLSPKTVDTYRSRLMRKLDLDDLPSLVKFAIQHGLTPPE